MSAIKDGGRAFPDGSTNEWGNANNGGMTLRDYFAAAAIPEVIRLYESKTWDETAELVYKMADAMLRTRDES